MNQREGCEKFTKVSEVPPNMISVHLLGDIFLLFTEDGIYAYGEENKVIEFRDKNKMEIK